MTTNQQQGKIYEHSENAQQADDPNTENYHISESLQLIRIADEAAYCEGDTTGESVD